MRTILIRFTVTLTPGCLDRMVATNCSLTGRTNQQRYKGTCGAAEFAKSSRENWSHGEQTVIVNARLSPGHPRLLMSSPGLPAPLKLRRASAGHTSALSRPNSPELCKDNVPRKTEGAGKAGCPMHPQPRTQTKKRTSIVTTGSPQRSGLPCAMVLTAYSALSSATNSSCHRHLRIKVCPSPVGPTRLRKLDISNGCQDHTVLPSASAPFVHALCFAHGKPALQNATRSTPPRPPHPTQRS